MGKVKEFVKKHKDAVPYVIGATAGLFLFGACYAKAKSDNKPADSECSYEFLDHPSLDEGTFSYYSEQHGGNGDGCHVGHMKEVPVSDLGKVGDTLKQCDGIDENSKISFLFTDYTDK